MRQLLTLMVLMILGALAVRTQQPSPYITHGRINGVIWRGLPNDHKLTYGAGIEEGFIQGMARIWQSQQGECRRNVVAATPAWAKSTKLPMNGAVVKAIDTFYQDGANISIPMIDAFEYSEMKLAGATKQQLDEYLTKARQATH